MALAAGQTGHLADHQEGVYVVVHGATAGTARPTLGSASTAPTCVLWEGTVEPTNAVNGDLWWDETNSLLKVKVSGSFVASGSAAYVPQTALGLLTSGEEAFPRFAIDATTVPLSSGTIRLAYFVARKTENIDNVRMVSGTTAAGATPTLCKMGLYSVDGSGNLTLEAATANDTSLFAATNTQYTRALGSTVAKTAGQLYALAAIVVTGATAPQVYGRLTTPANEGAIAPRLMGAVTGQTDLPASILVGSVVASANWIYGAVTP